MPDHIYEEIVHRDDLSDYVKRWARHDSHFIYSLVPDPDQPGFYRAILAPKCELEVRS